MHSLLPLVVGIFGLGAPEFIVLLVIVFVFVAGSRNPNQGTRSESDAGLTALEKKILLFVGAVAALGIGLVVWQKRRR